MRAFTYCCRSSADLYSEFSLRSPICRARWISFGRSTRYSFSSTFSSRSSLWIASANTRSLLPWMVRICVETVASAFRGCQNQRPDGKGGWGAFRPPASRVGVLGGFGIYLKLIYAQSAYRHLL